MKRILSIALSLGLALVGSTASAVEHIVRIEGPGYFPNIIYYAAGDTVKFENKSYYVARLKTSSGSWYSIDIPKNQSQTISLGTSSSFSLQAPFLVTGSSYFGGVTYGQYGSRYPISFVKGTAPNSCPDSRVIC